MKVRKAVLVVTVGKRQSRTLAGRKPGGPVECRQERRREGQLGDLQLGMLGSDFERASSRRQGGF